MNTDTFYHLIPYDTSHIVDMQLAQLLDRALLTVDRMTQYLFHHTKIDVSDRANYFGNSHYIETKAWQDDIVVYRDSIDHAQDTALTTIIRYGSDYIPHYATGTQRIATSPIIGIKLTEALSSNEFIRISGTYGWDDEYSRDVQYAVCHFVYDSLTQTDRTPSQYLNSQLYSQDFIDLIKPYLSKDQVKTLLNLQKLNSYTYVRNNTQSRSFSDR